MSEKILQLMGRLPGNAPSVSHEGAVRAEEPAAEEAQDRKRMRKAALVKLGAVCVLFGIVLVFVTISWFTMSNESSTSGMNMKVAGQDFDISMLVDTGTGDKEGIFKDPYHIKVHESDSLYWEMTAGNNLNNYNPAVENDNPALASAGDLGVYPNACGVISFYVTPKLDSLDLTFDFEVIGYQSTEANGQLVSMTPLSDLSDGEAARNVLNGHILLFEHRTGTAGNYKYSTPILSDGDMHRVFRRTISGKDQPTQVDIYWVWPNTLSTLVGAGGNAGNTADLLCADDDSFGCDSYSAVTANIAAYPHYYLKNLAADAAVTAEEIAAHYDVYGDMYDQGDNEIGMRVHYLLIKLSVTEGTAAGGGS